jgi:hypothetical protein
LLSNYSQKKKNMTKLLESGLKDTLAQNSLCIIVLPFSPCNILISIPGISLLYFTILTNSKNKFFNYRSLI